MRSANSFMRGIQSRIEITGLHLLCLPLTRCVFILELSAIGANFMNHVRNIREKAGITQAALRRSLGWNQSRLANYESGLRCPGLSEARLIVSALNTLGAKCGLDEAFPPENIANQSAA
ncbi:helix-turn-helix transcriptional regulator [Pseudomonas sp. GB2N2]